MTDLYKPLAPESLVIYQHEQSKNGFQPQPLRPEMLIPDYPLPAGNEAPAADEPVVFEW